MLSVDNCNKVIEDINRETTALLNTLNMYEDQIAASHEVHIKELITDRVIPFIEVAEVPCEIRLILGSKIPAVIGNYVNFSRALINIISNSLDAIREAERKGIIEISLHESDDTVTLALQDNGVGIEQERLTIGPDALPLFVGKTTKKGKTGEGIGTRQIFSTFGPANISVESTVGEGTRWTVQLKKSHPEGNRPPVGIEITLRHVYQIHRKDRDQRGKQPDQCRGLHLAIATDGDIQLRTHLLLQPLQ